MLSDSTEAYDRGKQAEHFRQIPSCLEYLLVSQKEPRLEQYIRQPNRDWILKEAAGEPSEIELPSLAIGLPLSEILISNPALPETIEMSARVAPECLRILVRAS